MNSLGYKGDHLKATLEERTATTVTTASAQVNEPYSKEQLKALSEASSHGQKFLLTGGLHLTSDMAFKAAELHNQKREYEQMEAQKKKRKTMEKRQEEGKLVLQKNKNIDMLNDTELKKLLAWYQIPAKETKTLAERRAKWKEIVEKKMKVPSCQLWTEEDEQKLNQMKSDEVDIKKTQLRRVKNINKLEFEANFKGMTKEERQEILSKLKSIDEEDVEVEQV